MSANDQTTDYRVAALEAAGFDAAARLLRAMPAEATPAAAKVDDEAEVEEAGPAESEGHAILEALKRSGAGRGWISGGKL